MNTLKCGNRAGFLGLFLGFLTQVGFAQAGDTLEQWIQKERIIAHTYLFKNISASGTDRGVVLAAPSKKNPDYYYHWTRDGALVMNTVLQDFIAESDSKKKLELENMLWDYVDFSEKTQSRANKSGGLAPDFGALGEPKFYVDGRSFEGPWGRPQNDGPALRSSVLIRFAGELAHLGRPIHSNLNNEIETDLDFLSYHADEPCFDLWEEVRGRHYYTTRVQIAALHAGAQFLSVSLYDRLADKLESTLSNFWNEDGTWNTSYDANGSRKNSNLDASTVLADLHTFTAVKTDRNLATLKKLEERFQALYTINSTNAKELAPAIGRYPEDIYDGNGTSTGNPWFLLTAGFAETYYHLAQEERASEIKALDKAKGDRFLARVQFHSFDGRLSEQFNRETGFVQGARDLSWSYAAVIEAIRARDGVK